MKSIEMCVNRFDEDTKTSFLDLYSKCDSEVVLDEEVVTETVSTEEVTEDNLNPF